MRCPAFLAPALSPLPSFRGLSPRCREFDAASLTESRRARRNPMPRASDDSPLQTLELPWACESSRSRGMLTTSFETCTVLSIARPTPYHIRCAVDMSVTCTASTYTRPGQWVWVKPWGDEDGNITACPLPHAPDGRATVDLCFRRAGAVAEAAEAGEMLEVSEVCGEGFGEGACAAAAAASHIWAFAAAESVLALLPVLESVPPGTPVRIVVCVGSSEVEDYDELYIVESEDTIVDFGGACAELLRDWAAQVEGRSVTVHRVSEDGGFPRVLRMLGSVPESSVALVACPWDDVESALLADPAFSKETVFVNR